MRLRRVPLDQHAAGLTLRSDVEIQENVTGLGTGTGHGDGTLRVGRLVIQDGKKLLVLEGEQASNQLDHAAAGAEVAKITLGGSDRHTVRHRTKGTADCAGFIHVAGASAQAMSVDVTDLVGRN